MIGSSHVSAYNGHTAGSSNPLHIPIVVVVTVLVYVVLVTVTVVVVVTVCVVDVAVVDEVVTHPHLAGQTVNATLPRSGVLHVLGVIAWQAGGSDFPLHLVAVVVVAEVAVLVVSVIVVVVTVVVDVVHESQRPGHVSKSSAWPAPRLSASLARSHISVV